MRPGTFAAIYAFEPVLFPVEVDNRQVLHATIGIHKHATCHENNVIDAIEPCRACYQTDYAASVATSSTRDSQARLLHAHRWTLWCLAFTATTFETTAEVSFRSIYSSTRKHRNQCEFKQLWTLHCAGPVSIQAKAMRHWLLWLGGADLTSRASKRPQSVSDQGHPSLHSKRTVLKSMWLMVCQSKQVCRSLLCCIHARPNCNTRVPYQMQLLVQMCELSADAAVVAYICVISQSFYVPAMCTCCLVWHFMPSYASVSV